MAKRFQSKAKKTHKMTRDGLVERNAVTGEESRISQRGQEFNLKAPAKEEVPGNATSQHNTPGRKTSQPQRLESDTHEVWEDQPHFEQYGDSRVSADRSGDSFSEQYGAADRDSHHDLCSDALLHRGEQRSPTLPQHSPGRSRDRPMQTEAASQKQQQSQRRLYRQPEQNSIQAAVEWDTKPHQTSDIPVSRESYQADNSAVSEPNLVERTDLASEHRIERKDFNLQSPVSEDGQPFRPTQRKARLVDHKERLQMEEGKRPRESGGKKKLQRGTAYSQKFADESVQERAVDTASAPPAEKAGDGQSQATGETIQRTTLAVDPAPAPQAASDGQAVKHKGTKLHFGADEKPPAPSETLDKRLDKANRKAARAEQKAEKAQAALPTQRRVRFQKELDTTSGKMKRRFHFEEEVKPLHKHMKGSLPMRPVKFAGERALNTVHSKIHQVESENVGVEAAHKGEKLLERGVRKAYRLHKSSPYRKAAKWQRKTAKLQAKAAYRKVLADNPKLRSNLLSRFMQKQKIKRQYASAMRNAKSAGKAAKRLAHSGTKLVSRAFQAIRSNPKVLIVIGLLFFLVIIISSIVTSCSSVGSGVMSAVSASTYAASDSDIDDAEILYTEWETELLMQVERAEQSHAGYDEYRYQIDDVSHDPYELMAYLTAVYGNFKLSEIQTALRALFDEQYQLSFTPETELRTEPDPVTGQMMQKQYRILNIKLTSKSLSDLIHSKLTSEQKTIFDLLMESKGNRQYMINPFDFNWLPYVTVYYGYRIHPTMGIKDFHKGVDIAVAAGTTIIAGHDGTISSAAFDSYYGNVLVLDDGNGFVSKYAHCQSMLVSSGQTVKKGDPIATVGSSGVSDGPHLHLELIKDGRHLNPLFFGQTGDFEEDSPVIPPYPGAPMDDAKYAALLAEAQKHLGKPYVFGSSGPNTFDCSGFICWVLDKSGVYPTGRTNAQGIYNKCTPVSKENAKPGDLIFFQKTYSTSNTVTHLGIYIGNGQMIHCGNPVQYTSINTKYWTEHFYAFGRIG